MENTALARGLQPHLSLPFLLGGDSKTLMVVQVAPVEKNVAETVCSLTFAQRVRAVELGQASKKVIGPPGAERAREWEMVSSVVGYACCYVLHIALLCNYIC